MSFELLVRQFPEEKIEKKQRDCRTERSMISITVAAIPKW
jgi:hypothetical protein